MHFPKLTAYHLLLTAYCLLLTAYCLLLTPYCLASDEPFTGPSNWGGTGLLEIPTARVMRENTFRFGVSEIHPYRYYYGAISPLKGLEIDGRITESLGVPVERPGWQGYGNTKDKSLDFKLRLFPEGKYTPAVALGIMDPHGTRLFSSQYLVLSKQIYPFDFTIGMGNGRFGKEPLSAQGEGIKIEMFQDPKEWLQDSQVFWGVQFAPSSKYALMFEYSPIKYEKQRGAAVEKYFKEPVASNYNFGLRWRPLKWTEMDLSYQRGNKIGVNFSMAFNIGKPIIPIVDLQYKEKPEEIKSPLHERITKALHQSGFSDIGVAINGSDLRIEAQNDKYYYPARAIGVILSLISEVLPENVHNIHIILKENNVPLVELSTIRSDVMDMHADKLTNNEFLYLSNINTEVTELMDEPVRYRRAVRYGVKPSLQTYLNDPSGFIKYRFGISGWVSYHPWRGSSFVAGLEGYPINNISTAGEPLSIPVRSDIALYKEQNIALGKLLFEQTHKMPYGIYGKVSAGFLEVQYAGLDGEIAMPLFDGRLLIGLSGSIVKKRDTDNPFELKENDAKDFYRTAFLNTRLNFPKDDISLDLKTGMFLAGDKGARITVSKFINGVTLSAWYSLTDTSVFKDEINRGYHDKGIAISIPMRLFEGTDTKTAYSYSLAAWTRDVAQDIKHHTELFDFIGRNIKIFLDRDRKMIYK